MHAGSGEQFESGTAGPLAEDEAQRVIAWGRRVEGAQGVVGAAGVGIGDGEAGGGALVGEEKAEAVVAIDAEGPIAGGGDLDGAGDFEDEVVVIGGGLMTGEGLVEAVMAALAGAEVVDAGGVFGSDGQVQAGIGEDLFGGNEVIDEGGGLEVAHGEARHFGFESDAGGALVPGGGIETDGGPGVVQRTIGGHEEVSGGAEGNQGIGGGGLGDTIGDITLLRGEGGGELMGDGLTVGPGEGEVFAVGAEAEIGVEFPVGDGPVFAGGEHDDEAVGGEGDGGELPFGEEVLVVGKVPTREVHRDRIGVTDFDPIGEFAVFV